MKNLFIFSLCTFLFFSCAKEEISSNLSDIDNSVLARVGADGDINAKAAALPVSSCDCNLIVDANMANTQAIGDWLVRFEYDDTNGDEQVILVGGIAGGYFSDSTPLNIDFTTSNSATFNTATLGAITGTGWEGLEIEVEVNCERLSTSNNRYRVNWDSSMQIEDNIFGTISNCSAMLSSSN